MNKFIITVANAGHMFYLRKTVWTGELERADRFDTESDARTALDKASKFMKVSVYKASKIVGE